MFFYIRKYVHLYTQGFAAATSMNIVNCAFARSMLAFPSPLQYP